MPVDVHPVGEAVLFGNRYRAFPRNQVLLDFFALLVRANLAVALMASQVQGLAALVSHALLAVCEMQPPGKTGHVRRKRSLLSNSSNNWLGERSVTRSIGET